MSRERKRERDEPKDKGVPVAPVGSDVIWDDLKLRVPFSSNPFITRMKGSAVLNMSLSFGLYYNELTKRWAPLTSATISEALIKARYYAVNPDALTLLSDNPLRTTNIQELMVKDTDLETKLELVRVIENAIKLQTDKLQFDGSNNLKCIIG